MTMKHKFVQFIPEKLDERILYISIEYATIVHSCACGCGEKVFTPLDSETGWKMTFDGNSISIYPSIGNWSSDCQSHYWITKNQVKWAEDWTTYSSKKKRKPWYKFW